VNFEPTDLSCPDQPRRAVDHQVLGNLAVALLDRHRFQRRRHALHRVLLKEALLARALGATYEAEWPAADVGQHARADCHEVFGEIGFGDGRFGEQQLVGVREPHFVYVFDLRVAFGHGSTGWDCTSLAGLSPRRPRYAGWRKRPSAVLSV